MRPLQFLAALLLLSAALPAQITFMGWPVTIIEPELEPDVFFSKGPASVCLERTPQRQCYTAKEDYGRDPKVEVIQIDKQTSALLFSVASGGVSGFGIHYALLRPGRDSELENFLVTTSSVTNQSQRRFLRNAQISEAPIFVTANYVWGMDEAHTAEHRYTISAYLYRYSPEQDSYHYELLDTYMTLRKYDLENKDDIIAAEETEILTRLSRVVAAHPNPKP